MTMSREEVQRDRRARSLAAMGLVRREGNRFFVKTAAMPDHQESYEVWRDEYRRPRCSCPEFEEQSVEQPAFRCEHLLAVKYWLTTGAGAANNDQANSSSKQAQEQQTQQTQQTQMMKPEIEEQKTAASESSGVEQSAAAPLRLPPFTNLLRRLRLPIDPKLIKTREGWTDRQGNVHWVEYIEWHTVADILDRITPDWSHAVRNITQIGETVAVTAAITIDGVTREGIGTGPAESETGIKKAEHDALKRAAVKFGIARDLYQRESEVIDAESPAISFPRDPRAKTVVELVSPKQLRMIRALGRESGCDVERECQTLLQCNLEEISKRAASRFIDHLKLRQSDQQAEEQHPEELQRAS